MLLTCSSKQDWPMLPLWQEWQRALLLFWDLHAWNVQANLISFSVSAKKSKQEYLRWCQDICLMIIYFRKGELCSLLQKKQDLKLYDIIYKIRANIHLQPLSVWHVNISFDMLFIISFFFVQTKQGSIASPPHGSWTTRGAAVSACEEGRAWREALTLFGEMLLHKVEADVTWLNRFNLIVLGLAKDWKSHVFLRQIERYDFVGFGTRVRWMSSFPFYGFLIPLIPNV